VLPIARADGQNDTHRVVLAEPVGLSTESSFESRVRVRLTRLLIVPTALSQIVAASDFAASLAVFRAGQVAGDGD
jgi:hypothetical protein